MTDGKLMQAPPAGVAPEIRRFALGVEYDGSGFSGWQTQPGGNTVQDVLEAALAAIAAAPVRVVAAGRTDAGVHATLQIVHFDTDCRRPLSAWVRGTNAHLPPTVAVRWAAPVERVFHARFSAISRAYTYALVCRTARPGLLAGRAGWYHRSLSLPSMRDGASMLVGRHDFSAFRAAGCQANTPVRTLHAVGIEAEGDLVLFHFRADAFLHHMVRNLVGSLVYVGNGRFPPAWIGEVLDRGDRACAAPTFAADGLYLAGVEYPPRWDLPESERAVPIRSAR